MDVSIIIPVHSAIDRIDTLFDSLKGLILATNRAECIFVTDRCDKAMIEKIRRECSKSKPDQWKRWQVFSCEFGNPDQARNLGIKQARGSIIALLDDDCRPCPKWLVAGAARLQHHKAVTGPVYHSDDIWGCLVAVMDFGAFQSDQSAQTDNFPGCNVFVPARAMSDYPSVSKYRYGGDRILAHKISAGRNTIGYYPDIAVTHHPVLGFSAVWTRERRYGHVAWAARKTDKTLPWGNLVNLGIGGIFLMGAGRILIDLKRLWCLHRCKHHRFSASVFVLLFRIPYILGLFSAYVKNRTP